MPVSGLSAARPNGATACEFKRSSLYFAPTSACITDPPGVGRSHTGGQATKGAPQAGPRDDGDSSMAYIPDVEYLDDAHRRPALELADGVDLLIHDAHHTAIEV